MIDEALENIEQRNCLTVGDIQLVAAEVRRLRGENSRNEQSWRDWRDQAGRDASEVRRLRGENNALRCENEARLRKLNRTAQHLMESREREQMLVEEQDRCFTMLGMHGVPRERTKTVYNGIAMLMTRMEQEIDSRDAALEAVRE